jgi:polyhydroxybutyrate depolymerase
MPNSGRELPQFNITYGGLARTYLLYTPSTAPPVAGYPVIVGYHGAGESSLVFSQQCRFTIGPLAASSLQIYPQGVQNSWNCGSGWYGYAAANNIDDIGFVQAVLAQVSGRVAVDSTRVYMTGMSNGSEFAASFGCANPTVVAGIAQISPALRGGVAPNVPMPVIMIKGDQDPVTPIAGGGSSNAPPFSALTGFWSGNNTTTGSSTSTPPDQAGLVTETDYTGGTATTRAYVVSGMGHQWPIGGTGTRHTSEGVYLGPICPVGVDLSPTILAFFAANHR